MHIKLRGINPCVREKLLWLSTKQEVNAEAHQPCFFLVRPSVTVNDVSPERKSQAGAWICFKSSKRSFIGCVCVGGITVSAKWSSFFRTGVPDWHKKTNETVSQTHSDPTWCTPGRACVTLTDRGKVGKERKHKPCAMMLLVTQWSAICPRLLKISFL